MNITQYFKLAVKSLRTSKMRAFLTMLGIIIGVGAVIIIISLGNGLQKMVDQQVESMGVNLIQTYVYGRGDGTTMLLDPERMYELVDDHPEVLSGGQQQRASIARALAGDPAVILADEPTGALDSHTGREVLTMLQQLHAAGNTVVLITHDNSIAVQAQRIIRLEDGHVIYDGDAGAPEAVVTPNLAGRGMAG